jgi:hypothetical protein
VSVVVSCPKCEKRLAVKDELKGRPLVCPQCKGRFSVPADESPVIESPADDGGVGFLDDLGPASFGAAKSTGATAPATSGARPAARTTAPAMNSASRAVTRAKKKAAEKTMIFIGGGIAAAVLIAILAIVIVSSQGGGAAKTKEQKPEIIRFGLADSVRHKLFKEMITAVDENGITAACKQKWYRLADEYKLDRSHLKDILDEGFLRDDWDQPAPAAITNKNRATRMEWIGQRHNGPDPVLAL